MKAQVTEEEALSSDDVSGLRRSESRAFWFGLPFIWTPPLKLMSKDVLPLFSRLTWGNSRKNLHRRKKNDADLSLI